ncbi:glycosyltransferase [Saxibacter everestensis]|uniref:Glycosyltransferase n=1 Tax=Saxibacter everestensis TaxID=2909229 RepID=A0ABY8QU82_9MICO|nr:glycosyltransferase [Brevibacteriaceae bacterium ZFBP1038]
MHVAILSIHTAPLNQPGSGDAGGLNVYVVQLAKQLVASGVKVEIFTADHDPDHDDSFEFLPGACVHQVRPPGEGPFDKATLAMHTAEIADAIGAHPAMRGVDVIHSHYWISGVVGLLLGLELRIPLVLTMHTLARVKNRDLRVDEEPENRISWEERLVAESSFLIANTRREAQDLVELYGADPNRLAIATPGVDHEIFRPASRAEARTELGLNARDLIVLFVGRIQYLKGPQILIDAVAELRDQEPDLASRVSVAMLGGRSGESEDGLADLGKRAAELGLAESVIFCPPVPPAELARWYAASDVSAVPSRSESFGLVAAEAGACGLPVIAAAVGGLSEVVDDGVSGVLVDSHQPTAWAKALRRVLSDDDLRAEMGRSALEHVAQFSWQATADRTLEVYRLAVERND